MDSPAPLPPAVRPEIFLALNLKEPGSYGFGCLTVGGLSKWVLPVEAERLEKLGFHIVRIDDATLLYSDAWQVIFRRKRPLKIGVAVVPWPRISEPSFDAAASE